MRRIKHGLHRLPKQLGHRRMPDYMLGAGVAGAVLVGTILPVAQAVAAPSPKPAATAEAAAPQAAATQGEQAASRGEAREAAPQPQPEQAAQPQAQPEQAAQPQPQPQPQPQQQAQPEQPKPAAEPAKPAKPSYSNNLDGWIREARDVLAAAGKPVPSYKAMYATAMAESTGNPKAVNGWDSNASSGTPSIGLTQMIQPTFKVYALPGHTDIRNPVDNLIASSRYCDAKYGSMDNMASARGYGSHWRGY